MSLLNITNSLIEDEDKNKLLAEGNKRIVSISLSIVWLNWKSCISASKSLWFLNPLMMQDAFTCLAKSKTNAFEATTSTLLIPSQDYFTIITLSSSVKT